MAVTGAVSAAKLQRTAGAESTLAAAQDDWKDARNCGRGSGAVLHANLEWPRKGPFFYPNAAWIILITASRSSGETALPFATPIILSGQRSQADRKVLGRTTAPREDSLWSPRRLAMTTEPPLSARTAVPRIRFSISELMLLVAIAACDLVFFRLQSPRMGLPWAKDFFDLFIVGFLPMANILVIGLVIGFDRQSASAVFAPALVRFELCGWAILLSNVICFGLFSSALHDALGKFAGSIAREGTSPLFGIGFLTVLVASCLGSTLAVTLVASRIMARYHIQIVIKRLDPPAGSRSVDVANLTSDVPHELSSGLSAR
jgi:hypothetical protein